MAKDKSKSKDSKFDYKGYVSNLGKDGTFYKDKKDSKGVNGTLVSIAENGVYAKVKGVLFPQLFARADFHTGFKTKCSCGKTITVTIGDEKSKDKKGKKGKSSSYSDDGSKGKFGENGAKKAKSLISFLEAVDDLDQHDDDDWEDIVEAYKKSLKAFK